MWMGIGMCIVITVGAVQDMGGTQGSASVLQFTLYVVGTYSDISYFTHAHDVPCRGA